MLPEDAVLDERYRRIDREGILEKIRAVNATITTQRDSILKLRESIIECESMKISIFEGQLKQATGDSTLTKQCEHQIATRQKLIEVLQNTNRNERAIETARKVASKSNRERLAKESQALSIQLKRAQAAEEASLEPPQRATLKLSRQTLEQKTRDVEAAEVALEAAHARLEQERAEISKLELEIVKLRAKENMNMTNIDIYAIRKITFPPAGKAAAERLTKYGSSKSLCRLFSSLDSTAKGYLTLQQVQNALCIASGDPSGAADLCRALSDHPEQVNWLNLFVAVVPN